MKSITNKIDIIILIVLLGLMWLELTINDNSLHQKEDIMAGLVMGIRILIQGYRLVSLLMKGKLSMDILKNDPIEF